MVAAVILTVYLLCVEKERDSMLSGGSGGRASLQPEHTMRTELESYVLRVPVGVRKTGLCQV